MVFRDERWSSARVGWSARGLLDEALGIMRKDCPRIPAGIHLSSFCARSAHEVVL